MSNALDRHQCPVKPRKFPTGTLVENCFPVAQHADGNLFSEYQRLLVVGSEVHSRVAATQCDICRKLVGFSSNGQQFPIGSGVVRQRIDV